MWVGGRKLFDGTWIWLDGTEFSYKNWASGEPSNNDGKEDAILINSQYEVSKEGNMEWNDAPNDVDLKNFQWLSGFLCQYKAF